MEYILEYTVEPLFYRFGILLICIEPDLAQLEDTGSDQRLSLETFLRPVETTCISTGFRKASVDPRNTLPVFGQFPLVAIMGHRRGAGCDQEVLEPHRAGKSQIFLSAVFSIHWGGRIWEQISC